MSNDLPDSSQQPSWQRGKPPRFISLVNQSAPRPTMVGMPVINAGQPRDGALQRPGDGMEWRDSKNTGDGPVTAPQRGIEALPPVFRIAPKPDAGDGRQAALPARNGIQPMLPTFDSLEQHPTVQLPISDQEKLERRNRAWKPGTSGFDDYPPPFERRDTFQMMVLRGIAQQQGSEAPVMQSEISGAASGAAIVGFGNVMGSILNYGSNFMIQRGFGPGPFGIYTLSYSLVSLVASIFTLGMDNAILRYIPVYRGKKQPGSLQGLVIFCTAVVGIAGILGALFVLFFTPLLVELRHVPRDRPLLIRTLEVMAPVIPLLCMQVVWYGGLQGFKAFKWRVLSQRILPSAAMILFLGVVLVFFRHLQWVVFALIANNLIATVLSLYYLFRLVSRHTGAASGRYEVREWLGFATPNFLTVITDTVMSSIDTLLLALFAISSVAIGQYAAAFKFSNFIAIPLISLNTMFAPTISELHSKGELKKLAVMFKVVTKWTLTLSLPVFGVATLFSPSLLALSGGGFVAAWPLLIAFAVGGIMNAGTGCVGYMLLMTGHQKLSFLNSLVGIIVNIVLSIILVPHYGAMGVAIGTGVAICVLNLLRLLQVRVLLKIQPYRADTLKPLAAFLLSAAVTGVPLFVAHLLHINLLFQLALVPVFLVVYLGLIVLFQFSSEDQIVVDKLRTKFMRGKK